MLIAGLWTFSVCGAQSIGKVIILKGDVKQILGVDEIKLHEGDLILEGAVVSTGPKSSVKFMLLDQTALSLGPDSSMHLDDVKINSISNVSVTNGYVRSKVIKDFLSNSTPSKKVKFILRTKSAVMGVRGTDFEVIYNSENQVTSLVTFEGAVAMLKIDPNPSDSFRQTVNLVPLLTSEKAVVVTEGRFSTVSPTLPQVTLPTKISPAQFETMKKSDPTAANQNSGSSVSQGNSKLTTTPHFNSIIPPGMDAKVFAGSNSGLDKQLASALGKAISVGALGNGVGGFVQPALPPPEGVYNQKTGAYAPPAGGFLDTKTGLYLAPPSGSVFDPNTGVYVPPVSLGKFDANTGSYVPPSDFKLDPKLGFVSVAVASANTTPSSGSGQNTGISANSKAPNVVVVAFPGLPASSDTSSSSTNGSAGAYGVMGGSPITASISENGDLSGANGNSTTGLSTTSVSSLGIANQFISPPPPNVVPPTLLIPSTASVEVPLYPVNTDPSCLTCSNPPSPPVTPIAPTSTNINLRITVGN